MFRDYFAGELEFLRDMGGEFAREFPEAAAELGLRGRDPDVERLLQGFAFLTARIHQGLDEEFSELLHPLINQIWPDALRPIPSVTMIEFTPSEKKAFRAPCLIRRGARLHSGELDIYDEPVRCTFTTCQDLWVLPLRLSKVIWEPQAEHERLQLDFAPLPGSGLDQLGDEPLRLHLCGDLRQTYGLYWGFSQHPKIRLQLIAPDQKILEEASSAERPDAIHLSPLGWNEDEALFPYPAHSFRGHRHLKEAFIFPEKHLLFDLHGLKEVSRQPKAKGASLLRVCLEVPAPADSYRAALSSENIRLYCVPAVNLFPHPATLRIESARPDHLLRPSLDRRLYDVFSIESAHAVMGSGRSLRRVPIAPFPAVTENSSTLLYQARPRPPVTMGTHGYHAPDIYLSFLDRSGAPLSLDAQTVDLSLLVTNRDLPTQHLRAGGITHGDGNQSQDLPTTVTAVSIGPISETAPAPVGTGGLGRFLAHAQLGWKSLATVGALQDLLRLYHLPALQSWRGRRRLDLLLAAIESVQTIHKSLLVGTPATPMRGSCVHVVIGDQGLEHPGQVRLFGAALSHFLAESATINTFVQLTLETRSLGMLTWPPRIGHQELL